MKIKNVRELDKDGYVCPLGPLMSPPTESVIESSIIPLTK